MSKPIPQCCLDQLFPFLPFKFSPVLYVIEKRFYKARLLRSNTGDHFMMVWSSDEDVFILSRRNIPVPLFVHLKFLTIHSFNPQFLSLKHIHSLSFNDSINSKEFDQLQLNFPNLLHLTLKAGNESVKHVIKQLPFFGKLRSLVWTRWTNELSPCDFLSWDPDLTDKPHFAHSLESLDLFLGWGRDREFLSDEKQLIKTFSKFKRLTKLEHESNSLILFEIAQNLKLPSVFISFLFECFPEDFLSYSHIKELMWHVSLIDVFYQFTPAFSHLKSLIVFDTAQEIKQDTWSLFNQLESLTICTATVKTSLTVFQAKAIQQTLISLEIRCYDRNIFVKLPNLSQFISLKTICIRNYEETRLCINSLSLTPPPKLRSMEFTEFVSDEGLFKTLRASTFLQRLTLGCSLFKFRKPSDLYPMMLFLRELKMLQVRKYERALMCCYQEHHCPQLCLEFY
jgi:hypothetical protein